MNIPATLAAIFAVAAFVFFVALVGALLEGRAAVAAAKTKERELVRSYEDEIATLRRDKTTAVTALTSVEPAMRDAVDEMNRLRAAAKDADRRRVETAAIIASVIAQRETVLGLYTTMSLQFANAQATLWAEVEALAILAGRKASGEVKAACDAATAQAAVPLPPLTSLDEARAALDAVANGPAPAPDTVVTPPIEADRKA